MLSLLNFLQFLYNLNFDYLRIVLALVLNWCILELSEISNIHYIFDCFVGSTTLSNIVMIFYAFYLAIFWKIMSLD